jgi:hypothetical protein
VLPDAAELVTIAEGKINKLRTNMIAKIPFLPKFIFGKVCPNMSANISPVLIMAPSRLSIFKIDKSSECQPHNKFD